MDFEPNKIFITFSHYLKEDVTIDTDDLSVGGTSFTISSATIFGNMLILTMSDNFTSSDTITVSYTKNTAWLVDSSTNNNVIPSFSGESVTNNVSSEGGGEGGEEGEEEHGGAQDLTINQIILTDTITTSHADYDNDTKVYTFEKDSTYTDDDTDDYYTNLSELAYSNTDQYLQFLKLTASDQTTGNNSCHIIETLSNGTNINTTLNLFE